MRQDFERIQSPRPATPEPGARQGHRNITNVQLLDADGAISDRLEQCLKHIFAKYCTPPTPMPMVGKRGVLLTPPEGSYLTQEGLDAWATDTNGAPFSEETKEELREFLDVTEKGWLTFKGFLQIYQLQSSTEEEETWRDLSNHGFDRSLRLIASRREDADEVDSPHQTNRTFY